MPQANAAGEIEGHLDVASAGRLFEGLLPRQGQEDENETDESGNATDESDTDTETEEGSEPDQDEQSDDDESAEDEAEETSESEDETDDDTTPQLHKVLVDGQEIEVTYEELKAGFSRTRDYTQKTQAVAAQRKQVEAEATQVRAQRARYDGVLKQAEDALVAMMPQEPDWDTIRRDHPTEYPALFTDWQRYQERLAAVRSERSKVAQEEATEKDGHSRAAAKEEFDKLLLAVPEWRDSTKRELEFAQLADVVRSYGFTNEELNTVADHRTLLLFRDAMRYQSLVKKQQVAKDKLKKAGGAGPVKPAKPGAAGARNKPVTAFDKAAGRLAKSGDIDDAADAFTILEVTGRSPKGGRQK